VLTLSCAASPSAGADVLLLASASGPRLRRLRIGRPRRSRRRPRLGLLAHSWRGCPRVGNIAERVAAPHRGQRRERGYPRAGHRTVAAAPVAASAEGSPQASLQTRCADTCWPPEDRRRVSPVREDVPPRIFRRPARCRASRLERRLGATFAEAATARGNRRWQLEIPRSLTLASVRSAPARRCCRARGHSPASYGESRASACGESVLDAIRSRRRRGPGSARPAAARSARARERRSGASAPPSR